ncbi:hypothetical protein EYB26_005053 [Talaromyces marneffei]|uniref:uncharacterized protein n=1 Tax=Talaromyces marneffei TaxID=37727 RepID=UPI0012A9718C|nr:uncharacterized protein EYB26_005053 [Talaromyces marneffei]QGA17382.1 hypothetical protein EYB26_005053 [Talaromyces marneffei]
MRLQVYKEPSFIRKSAQPRGRALLFDIPTENEGGALFMSPSKVQQARDNILKKDEQAAQEQARKDDKKLQQELTKQAKEQEKAERAQIRQEKQEQRLQEATEKQRLKDEQELAKLAHLQLQNDVLATPSAPKRAKKQVSKQVKVKAQPEAHTEDNGVVVTTNLTRQNQSSGGSSHQAVKDGKGREGSLVVEFTNPIVANSAISMGTVWQSRSLTNRPYCREGRCPHKAVSTSCPIRKIALERAQHALMTCEPFHRVPQHLQTQPIQQTVTIDPTPSKSTQIQAPKRAIKKTTSTTKRVKKTQLSTETSISIPITETSAPAPAPESTIERPATLKAPTAPQASQRTIRGSTNSIPLTFKPVTEKPKRGRPPKSKSFNNDDQEQEPTEHINTTLAASQPVIHDDTIAPQLLTNPTIPSTAPPATRSRGLNQPVDMRNDPERPLREQRRRERSQEFEPTLPPLPPMSMSIEQGQIVLNSTASFREIDNSDDYNSDLAKEFLDRFTYSSQHRRVPAIQEEKEDDQITIQSSIVPPSSPDELN